MPLGTPNTTSPHLGGRILTVNGGSSSVKFALFDTGDPLHRIHSGAVDRINSRVVAIDWLDNLERSGHLDGVVAVGHRVVHGGPKHFDPQPVSPDLLADLRAAIPFAPAHLPDAIQLMETVAHRLPGVPQIACFDTAFHRDLPAVAQRLPIPRNYADAGLRRYGFHGLSYAYLMEECERRAGLEIAQGRVILAHLGSGASMAAVRAGKCIDTTMGLTPAGGLVMGTRTGDLDPGVLIHLARTEKLSIDQLEELVTRRSGLLGVSGTSSDMRHLLAAHATDPRAVEAVELFCYQIRKCVGSYAAALGGLDTLVFSGGIGEHAPEVRTRVCEGLQFLGIQLDPAANAGNAPIISVGAVVVRVIPTDEEFMIARTVSRFVGAKS
jgi:acetate kinase